MFNAILGYRIEYTGFLFAVKVDQLVSISGHNFTLEKYWAFGYNKMSYFKSAFEPQWLKVLI